MEPRGAQAKIALLYDQSADRWGIPSGATPTTHIVKPAIGGLDDFDIKEHLCLAAARRAGLIAATTSIRTFGAERALVVERYDRRRFQRGWRLHSSSVRDQRPVRVGHQLDDGSSADRDVERAESGQRG